MQILKYSDNPVRIADGFLRFCKCRTGRGIETWISSRPRPLHSSASRPHGRRGRSRALVERLGPTHVILRRGGPPELYYLVPGRTAISCLGRIPEAAPTGEAFDRAGLIPTLLVDGHEDADAAPVPCLVLDEGRLLGVYDAGEPVAFDLLAGSSAESWERSLVAEFPERIALHREASLLVSLAGDFSPAGSLLVILPVGWRSTSWSSPGVASPWSAPARAGSSSPGMRRACRFSSRSEATNRAGACFASSPFTRGARSA